MEGSLLYVVKN